MAGLDEAETQSLTARDGAQSRIRERPAATDLLLEVTMTLEQFVALYPQLPCSEAFRAVARVVERHGLVHPALFDLMHDDLHTNENIVLRFADTYKVMLALGTTL